MSEPLLKVTWLLDGAPFDQIASVVWVGKDTITVQSETGYKKVKKEDIISIEWKRYEYEDSAILCF